MKPKIIQRNKGFMALTATLILGAVLAIMMSANSTSSFFARFDVLGNEFKRTSLGLSEACVNQALLNVAQDYGYDPHNEVLELKEDYECIIESVKYFDVDDPDEEISSMDVEDYNSVFATIKAKAEYMGSWSTNEIKAKIKNPAYSATAIPPSCVLSVSDNAISNGEKIDLIWNTSYATDFDVQALTNNFAPANYNNLTLPSDSLEDLSPTESTTYVGLATGANGYQVQCVASVEVTQTIGECAETVVMLDRTWSMFGDAPDYDNHPEYIADEKDAAKDLLDLYSAVFPIPKVGLGRFPDEGGTLADLLAPMTSIYGIRGTAGTSSSGPNNGSSFSNVSLSGGAQNWSNPASVSAAENSRATVTLSSSLFSSSYSHYVRATGFGFNIPSTATIEGIRVEIERHQSGSGSGNIRDNVVRLVKNNSVVGQDKGTSSNWPTSDAYATYGGNNDEWSESWTPADINNANFGVVLSAEKTGGLGSTQRTANVDHIRISVFYSFSATGLYAAIDNGLNKTSAAGYTNLGAAISIARSELTGGNHTDDKSQVLILISDGEPNRPGCSGAETCAASLNAATSAANSAKSSGIDIFGIHFGAVGNNNINQTFLASLTSGPSFNDGWEDSDTGFLSTTQSESPNNWTNPANGYTSNDLHATETTNSSAQGYRNFNFSIPSGSTIQGIEVELEAHAIITQGTFGEDFGTSGSNSNSIGNSWSEGGGNSTTNGTIAKVASSGNDTLSPDGGRFALIEGNGGYICRTINTSSMTSPTLSYYWRGDTDAEDNENGEAQYRTSGNCTSGSGWTTINHELDNGNNNAVETWLQNTINVPASSNLIVRFRSASNSTDESFRIDGVLVRGNPPPSNARLQVRVSGNGSPSFSEWQTTTSNLNTTDTVYALGGATNLWDEAWTYNSFTNNNFRLEVRPTSLVSGETVYLDNVRVKVRHAYLDADAENSDGDYFFIAPNSADMSEVFDAVGKLACEALSAPPSGEEPPEPPSPPPPPPPIDIGSWDEIINI